MIKKDDRTEEQKKTHFWAIAATDKFMSEWGEATSGKSKCAWACPPDGETLHKVEKWVENRSDMIYVNKVDLRTYRPKCVHFQVYVINKNHPALK